MKAARLFIGLSLLASLTASAAPQTSYFSCLVKEKSGRRNIDVTVKFAVKDLGFYPSKGSLEVYPGADEEYGAILVSPMQGPSGHYTLMSNLNGQGGDLRVDGNELKLWGDGDGVQFTQLVLWADNEEGDKWEGYVRDYGSTYREEDETFKQFIKCQRAYSPL